jgi:flagellar biogenesis protein FliO
MAEQSHDTGRNSPAQRADAKDKTKAGAASAATGAGCLFTALMPWSLLILVFLIIAVVWIVWKFMNAPA